MRLTVIGGGGFRVPLIYRALLDAAGSSPIDELVLFDTAKDRLTVVGAVLAGLAGDRAGALPVRVTSDLADAVTGADFVFCAIRVGGAAGRVQDERIAARHGLLGQETTGPGGLAYGIRTIPVALDIAEHIHRLAPGAYVINFTNPVGMVTEAMQRVLGDRVVGVCDTPTGLGRRVARMLSTDHDRVELDYVGLNHLGWLRGIRANGVDLLPGLLADDTRLRDLDEAGMFGADWLRRFGCVPNEYLYYYYRNREARSGDHARGEYVARTQDDFYRAAAAGPDHAYELWRSAAGQRSAQYMAEARGRPATTVDDEQGYERVALAVMEAVAHNRRTTMIVNVRNGATLPVLPPDAVIEVPALLDASGARPLSTRPPALHQAGLMQQVKDIDRLAIEAAVTRSPEHATLAFGLHPLVDSLTVGADLFGAYRAAIPEFAAVFDRSRHP
jgi:6-phospho-beta-glucosidase